MLDCELLDLDTRPNKAGGGYTTTFPAYRALYFANFNGTSGDVDVLTHEAGHAFMAYQCRDFKLLETVWPTYEACEIHSMSMEFSLILGPRASLVRQTTNTTSHT